jgi:hypothetical protein
MPFDSYVAYIENVLRKLMKLPKDKFNKKMEELSNPETQKFLRGPFFSGEPTVNCYPTPRAYQKLVEHLNGNKS